MKVTIQDYLTLSQSKKIRPTFFHSLPYLKLSEAKISRKGNRITENGWDLFQPLEGSTLNKIWVSHINPTEETILKHNLQFLDYEYLYNPAHFLDLSGGIWNVYRKNIRKWPKEHEKWEYSDRKDNSQIVDLISAWVEEKMESIQDVKLIYDFILRNEPGVFIKYLYDGKELVGINAWDENWVFINFRFCITKPNSDFLQEFIRYQFYTDPQIYRKGKLVNDGGSLNTPGLEKFKDKLNPIEKNKYYSFTP